MTKLANRILIAAVMATAISQTTQPVSAETECPGRAPCKEEPPKPRFGTLVMRSSSAASNDTLWPATNVVSGGTYSSNAFPNAQNTRNTFLATWPTGPVLASAVVLRARMVNGKALAFPKSYAVSVTNPQNTGWVRVGTFTAQPNAAGVVAIAIAGAPKTFGALVEPTVLGTDQYGGYYFQLDGIELAQTTHAAWVFGASGVAGAQLSDGASFAASVGLVDGDGLAGLAGPVSYVFAAASTNAYQPRDNGNGTVTYFGWNALQAQQYQTTVSTGNSIADGFGKVAGIAAANGTNSDGQPFAPDATGQQQIAQAAADAAAETLANGGDLNDAADAAADAAQAVLDGMNTDPGGADGEYQGDMAALGTAIAQAIYAHAAID